MTIFHAIVGEHARASRSGPRMACGKKARCCHFAHLMGNLPQAVAVLTVQSLIETERKTEVRSVRCSVSYPGHTENSPIPLYTYLNASNPPPPSKQLPFL